MIPYISDHPFGGLGLYQQNTHMLISVYRGPYLRQYVGPYVGQTAD